MTRPIESIVNSTSTVPPTLAVRSAAGYSGGPPVSSRGGVRRSTIAGTGEAGVGTADSAPPATVGATASGAAAGLGDLGGSLSGNAVRVGVVPRSASSATRCGTEGDGPRGAPVDDGRDSGSTSDRTGFVRSFAGVGGFWMTRGLAVDSRAGARTTTSVGPGAGVRSTTSVGPDARFTTSGGPGAGAVMGGSTADAAGTSVGRAAARDGGNTLSSWPLRRRIALKVMRAAASSPVKSRDCLIVGTGMMSRQLRDGTGLALREAGSKPAPSRSAAWRFFRPTSAKNPLSSSAPA